MAELTEIIGEVPFTGRLMCAQENHELDGTHMFWPPPSIERYKLINDVPISTVVIISRIRGYLIN